MDLDLEWSGRRYKTVSLDDMLFKQSKISLKRFKYSLVAAAEDSTFPVAMKVFRAAETEFESTWVAYLT